MNDDIFIVLKDFIDKLRMRGITPISIRFNMEDYGKISYCLVEGKVTKLEIHGVKIMGETE